MNIEYLESNFELVFTHDISLLSLSNKFKLVICGAKHWVKDIGIHSKGKLISMIASTKIMCPEHKYRQDIVVKYRNELDLFGRGYNNITTKEIGLKDYYFSVTIENCREDYYFSEKLIDCFMSGTVPIYWGCPSIGNFFDMNGIIVFQNIEELDTILESLTNGLYYTKKESIENNFELAKKYLVAEDEIYKNIKGCYT